MKPKKKYPYNPDYAVPPGETIREVMETFRMAKNEFAIRLGISVQTMKLIFNGEQPITSETANRLEMVTGTPASFWNKLESNYQEQLAKFADGNISHKGTKAQRRKGENRRNPVQ